MKLLLAAFGIALAGPALAQPATMPTRDVAITYRLAGAAHDSIPGGAPGNIHLIWDAAQQRLRVDADGRAQSLLVDLRAPRVELIDSGLRSAITLHVRPRDLEPLNLRDAHLTPRGQATVAGRVCTDYAVEARRGNGTVCLTDDGVALRGQGVVDGREGSFTAIAVAYRPAPPAAFEVPQGYMHLALPPGLDRLR